MSDAETKELMDAAKQAVKQIALLTPFSTSSDPDKIVEAVGDAADKTRTRLSRAIALFEMSHAHEPHARCNNVHQRNEDSPPTIDTTTL